LAHDAFHYCEERRVQHIDGLILCESDACLRCEYCGYFCTLPLGAFILYSISEEELIKPVIGHPQQEHETSHGSMSKTKWAIEDGSIVEVNGRKFGAKDDGAPLLVCITMFVPNRILIFFQCSMLCKELGRHAHIDYCRTEPGQPCTGPGIEHISAPLHPNPNKAKDFVVHDLYWRRTGELSNRDLLIMYS
jgi:hypothetical protein